MFRYINTLKEKIANDKKEALEKYEENQLNDLSGFQTTISNNFLQFQKELIRIGYSFSDAIKTQTEKSIELKSKIDSFNELYQTGINKISNDFLTEMLTDYPDKIDKYQPNPLYIERQSIYINKPDDELNINCLKSITTFTDGFTAKDLIKKTAKSDLTETDYVNVNNYFTIKNNIKDPFSDVTPEITFTIKNDDKHKKKA